MMAKKKAAKKVSRTRKDTVSDVLPEMPGKIVFMGLGMSQKQSDAMAAAMRRKMGGGE
jgi:hypothetical protein